MGTVNDILKAYLNLSVGDKEKLLQQMQSIETSKKSNGKAIANILERMAKRNTTTNIKDPSTWQRNIREDRSQPGRS